MASRYMDLERRTLIVQFIAVEPLAFYATSDGTDLVQDILRSKLARPDKDIIGQEGSLSVSDTGEFLAFEPTDTKNRTLHLPVEHLAYCGALRRMRRDPSDDRNPDQIIQRDFENVDLANRYAHRIIGPPIFVAVFHGFDNALCYTFITQSTDDACLLVLKLMRAFNHCEQQHMEKQGQVDDNLAKVSICNSGLPSSTVITQSAALPQRQQTIVVKDNRAISSPTCVQLPNAGTTVCVQKSCEDDLVQRLLSHPNLQVVNRPYTPPRIITRHINTLPPPPKIYYSDPPATTIVHTADNGCCPCSSYGSFLPRDSVVCNTSCCTQCSLQFPSQTVCVIDDPLSSPFCYSV
ncbi:unnamed protein product [Adineta ricciae]|uniref:Uncharacterized protein n=1 Tax=Adineta ricciae TaxID=249248 RepID=A0A813ZA26_ADIRI|nr:unnamed protein product [Adineta ricciae]CAF0967118.1 unnamed protein product [Adineta ricciae]